MTSAVFAHGTLLKLGDGGGPETFATIAEVRGISGPSLAADAIEATNHDSEEAWREFIGGLKDGGEVSFDINFIPDEGTHDASTGLASKVGYKDNYQLVFPTSPAVTWSFPAVLTGFEPTAPIDDVLTAAITLKVAGKPTLA